MGSVCLEGPVICRRFAVETALADSIIVLIVQVVL
jgi:hypothetical protein